MKNIITIGGSNSKNSISKQLAEYAGSLVEGVNLVNIDLNDFEMPLFSVDVEAENGNPITALALNETIEIADGFVISLAEHNGAYSVAFKNMFDWLSRINSEVWRNKPMLLLATSPGPRGGQTVLEIAKGRFPFNGGNIIESLSVPSFNDNFKNGVLVNDELKKVLLGKVANFQKAL
jgi:NAD(P)H-dependent FMN reductase